MLSEAISGWGMLLWRRVVSERGREMVRKKKSQRCFPRSALPGFPWQCEEILPPENRGHQTTYLSDAPAGQTASPAEKFSTGVEANKPTQPSRAGSAVANFTSEPPDFCAPVDKPLIEEPFNTFMEVFEKPFNTFMEVFLFFLKETFFSWAVRSDTQL